VARFTKILKEMTVAARIGAATRDEPAPEDGLEKAKS